MRFYRPRSRYYRDVRFERNQEREREFASDLEDLRNRTSKGEALLAKAVGNYKMAQTYLLQGKYQDSARYASAAAQNISDALHSVPQSDKDMSMWIKMLDK